MGPERARKPLPLIDAEHLRAQTFEDGALEREVLTLFLEQLSEADRSALRRPGSGLLHKLKGSAAGVGAFALARQCAELELTPGDPAGWVALDALLERTLRAAQARLAELGSPA